MKRDFFIMRLLSGENDVFTFVKIKDNPKNGYPTNEKGFYALKGFLENPDWCKENEVTEETSFTVMQLFGKG